MTATSPRVDPRLVAVVSDVDDASRPIAETWRAVGRRAEEMGFPRPGYDTIRLLVHAHRERRREIERLLAPVLANLLAGRGALADLERVARAAEVGRAERRARWRR